MFQRINQSLLHLYTRYLDTRGASERLSYWLRDYVNDPLSYLSNFSKNYKRISISVRLIWGNKDTITPIEGTGILLGTIPDVSLRTLDGVGHIPMVEDYEKFDTALLESLTN